MTINKDLFMAILAMDSANRGYYTDVDFDKLSQLSGDTSVLHYIGGAMLGISSHDTTFPFDDQAISFFAQSYLWRNQTVISYRGTDQLPDDVLSGYGVGFGFYDGCLSRQGAMAAQFYQTILGNGAPGSVILTGHSLGGGLAGLVGGVYGSETHLYNPMPFVQALRDFRGDLDRGTIDSDFVGDSTYLQPDPRMNRGNIQGYYISGEMLEAARAVMDAADSEGSPIIQFKGDPILRH